ncbi:glycosyltransferase [Nocardioides maradonensis]
MSDILFVTWDGGGNVPPLLAIAAETQRRGHAVRVLGHPQQADAVAAAGLPFVAYRSARPFSGSAKNSPLGYIAMFGDRGMGRDVAAELSSRPADLVVVDCLLHGVLPVLRDAEVRYVVLEHLFDEFLEKRWMRGPMGLGMRVKRLAPARSLEAASLRLVASLPELDPAGGLDGTGNRVWSGPAVDGVRAAPAEPTILVSLSTNAFPGLAQTLQNVLDACGGLAGVRVVATTGPAVDPDELHWSANTTVHRWLPHAEVLPRASLVVGHGGHATTMLALAHDLPLLVLPSHPMLDQSMVGAAVESAGAGRVLSRKATPDAIRAAVVDLLAGGPHRAAAARLGEAIRSRRGATYAADLLERQLALSAS